MTHDDAIRRCSTHSHPGGQDWIDTLAELADCTDEEIDACTKDLPLTKCGGGNES